MTAKKFDSDFDERGLLPYPVIVAATKRKRRKITAAQHRADRIIE